MARQSAMVAAMTESPGMSGTAEGWIPNNDFSDRLAVVRSRMGRNYAEIGALCDLDGEAWGRWELKGQKPRNFEEVCNKISQKTGVSLVWLMTGQGKPAGPPDRRIRTGTGPAGGPAFKKVRREGLEPPTRCLRGIAVLIGIRRQKKPDIIPRYDDNREYTRPIAA